jgi:hypothetical protein
MYPYIASFRRSGDIRFRLPKLLGMLMAIFAQLAFFRLVDIEAIPVRPMPGERCTVVK